MIPRLALFILPILLLPVPARAGGLFSRVTITCEAEGAVVKYGRRATPAPRVLRLRRGRPVNITVSAPGRTQRTLSITPRKRRETIPVELEPVMVRLEVSPAGQEGTAAALVVNGEQRARLPAVLQVIPGRHHLQVQKEGYKPWSRWITLVAGEGQALEVTLLPASGEVLITTSPAGAAVMVDGKALGAAPLTARGLEPGGHVVEARAEGYAPRTAAVTVSAGEIATVTLTLDRVQQKPRGGTLQVISTPQPVDLFLDGTFRGKTPLTLEDLADGTHIVSARWPGHTTAEREVPIRAGQITTIKLALAEQKEPAPASLAVKAGGGNLLVVSSVRNASVYLDGVLVGQTPYAEPDVEAGPHRVRVAYPGYADLLETFRIRAGKTVRVTAMLRPEGSAADPVASRRKNQPRSATRVSQKAAPLASASPPPDLELLSYNGALLLPPGRVMVDLSTGFPFLITLGVRTGIIHTRHLAVDAGITVRTFGDVTEGGAMVRLRVMRFDPVALALDLSLLGGGGPAGRETFTANAGVATSVVLMRRLTLTLWLGGDFYSDRLCPDQRDPAEVDACVFPPRDLDSDEVRARHDGARFKLGILADWRFGRWVSIHAALEGMPGMDGRRLFTSPFVDLMPAEDPLVYGRVGATVRF